VTSGGRRPGRGTFGDELRWALGFVLPYRKTLGAVLALSLAGTVVALFIPYLTKLLVDDALVGRNAEALYRIVALFLALTVLNFAINVGSGLVYARTSAGVLFDMRLALYRHLQTLSPRFYARTPLGEIVSRINNDIGEIQRVVSDTALAWIGHLLFLGGAIAVMLWLDPRLFAISVLLLPASVVALIHYRRRLEGSIGELRSRSAEIGTFLIETLQAMRLIAGFNAQEREAGRFRERNDAFVSAMLRMQWLRYLSGGLPHLILAIGTALVFLYGGVRVISGTLTLGTFVAFMAYQMRLLGPVQGLMGLYANLATVRVSLRRVHELLETPAEVVERPDSRPIPTTPGELRLEAVRFAFGEEPPVLDGVTLRVRAGERVAIVGASGSGKSTIADLLLRHLDPQAGRILLDGVDLRELRLADVRRHVGTVEQEPFLFHVSLLENVRYARPEATEWEVRQALIVAGLEDLLQRIPEGLRTVVGERGKRLSVGERQRVALARAILSDPAVLVLDEPTAALDPVTEAITMEGVQRERRTRTLVVITHRLELARRFDRVVVLSGGRIVEEGDPGELLRRPGRFRELMVAGAGSRGGEPPEPAGGSMVGLPAAPAAMGRP
jgi:ATP-binding cassette, subfamily B, bacterial